MKRRYSHRSALVLVAILIATLVLIARAIKSTGLYLREGLERKVTYQGQRCFEGLVSKVANGEEVWLTSGTRVVIQGADSPKGRDVIPAVRELERLVLGKKVIVCPCEKAPKDSHGRLRAQLFISGESVAEHLLKKCVVGLHYFAKCDSKIVDELYRAFFEGWQSGQNLCKDKKIIQSQEAKDHIGSVAIVEGTIVSKDASASPILFEMQGLKLVVFRGDLHRLKHLKIDDWRKGTRLKVFGKISEYSGPEIILRSAHQVLEVKHEDES